MAVERILGVMQVLGNKFEGLERLFDEHGFVVNWTRRPANKNKGRRGYEYVLLDADGWV